MKKTKKTNYDKKWRDTFKKAGFGVSQAKSVEVDGVVYESLTDAAITLGKSISWIKKNGTMKKNPVIPSTVFVPVFSVSGTNRCISVCMKTISFSKVAHDFLLSPYCWTNTGFAGLPAQDAIVRTNVTAPINEMIFKIKILFIYKWSATLMNQNGEIKTIFQ